MADKALIENHLAEAERHLAEGWECITRQEALIQKLQADGRAKKQAYEILILLRESLDIMHFHRETIITELNYAD